MPKIRNLRVAVLLVAAFSFITAMADSPGKAKDEYIKGLSLLTQGRNDKALKQLVSASANGNIDADYQIWLCCKDSLIVGIDPQMCLQHLVKAAEGGVVAAQDDLGLVYFTGELVPQDITAGFSWYKKAAESDDETAIKVVALCYQKGYGVEADPEQALLWSDKLDPDKKQTHDNMVDDQEHVLRQPCFKGGEKAMYEWLGQHVQWPQALDPGFQGKVMVHMSFTVDTTGEISDVKVARNTGPSIFGVEAKRLVLSMPKWSPGTCDDKPVKVSYVLPITFKKNNQN